MSIELGLQGEEIRQALIPIVGEPLAAWIYERMRDPRKARVHHGWYQQPGIIGNWGNAEVHVDLYGGSIRFNSDSATIYTDGDSSEQMSGSSKVVEFADPTSMEQLEDAFKAMCPSTACIAVQVIVILALLAGGALAVAALLERFIL